MARARLGDIERPCSLSLWPPKVERTEWPLFLTQNKRAGQSNRSTNPQRLAGLNCRIGAKGHAPSAQRESLCKTQNLATEIIRTSECSNQTPVGLIAAAVPVVATAMAGSTGSLQDWWDAVILFDGTLRVDASQRIDGFVADRATLALGVCDRRVIVPGVHWGPGSTSSAKMHPCSTLHEASPPGMEDGSRSPVLGSLVVPSQQATAINSVGRRRRHRSRRHRRRHSRLGRRRHRSDRRRRRNRRRHRYAVRVAWPR